MTWVFFSIATAFFWATADLISKIAMNRRGYSEYLTLYARFVHSLPVLLLFLLATWPHRVDPLFWLMCLLVIPGDIVASTFYIKALKISPISVVIPLMSFAPVFMLVTSTLMLKEPPSPTGLMGVILVTIGAYLLHLDKAASGPLEPLKALVKERGPRMVLAAAFIFSIDTALGKRATQLSTPIFFSFAYCLFMAIGYIPFVKAQLNSREGVIRFSKDPFYWCIGLCFAGGVICFLYAIKLSNIAYVSALGKVSMIIAVIYGKLFFHEEKLRQKLVGVLFMLVGIFLLTLFRHLI